MNEMEFKNQLEKISEEESVLLKRIGQKIRMQAIIKKRQERPNILRRIAGEKSDIDAPSTAEIDELSKIEKQRAAEVSKTIFLALQAENSERTFHQVARPEDKDGKSEYKVDIIVSVKRLK